MKKLLIYRLANLVLTKNYFSFNNKLYRKIQGTAMGTRMAPFIYKYIHEVYRDATNRHITQEASTMAQIH